ncbi:sugar transporter [Kingella sp. (in: b-proteobacteria)]|uniref:sugar transporter n=1 Tax=Kingella sp. (in: b-proteobacteria) TaxID=2020713 RepID=UPI0026DB2BDE|nr:sugar transporter [Kingella sp. (in: b-proteobacteria)]MDO4657759.1 sugar transporter [Kingella sp. (in: b-proteobacteria)]
MLTKKTAIHIAYLRVLAFAIAAFVVNTTEFIPVAMLTDIGKGFNLPASQTGIMITVYAWVVSLASLPLMLLLAKMERRRLLMGLFTLFIAGHALSVAAWNFPVLLVSRVMIALTHAVFWSITAVLVMRVAPRGKRQQALGWMSLGSAMATVLGLPLGRIIGQALGWRATFALIGVLAIGVMLLLMKILPRLESKNSGSLTSLPQLAKRPRLLGLYALCIIMVTAHFTAYSYIEPYALTITQLSEQMTTWVLLVFGVSGMAASMLFARFYPRHPNPTLLISGAVVLLSLLLLKPLGQQPAALFALIFAWGIGIACISLSMIGHVMSYAPDAADVANAIYSACYNIGIGGGALLGGLVMRAPALGLANVGWVGAALAALALTVFVWTQKRFQAASDVESSKAA